MSDNSENEHVLNQTQEFAHIGLPAIRALVVLSLGFRDDWEVGVHSFSLLKYSPSTTTTTTLQKPEGFCLGLAIFASP